jgi:AraC family transcriptional regulator
MSATHFGHLFKRTTGQTPHQYVITCQIARAKQLLTETTLSISDLGSIVGFMDQSYFTALFRKQVGMTPKAYRDAIIRA